MCSGCGQPRHESFDRRNERAYKAERVVCHACAARDRKAKNFHDSDHADPAGSFFVVSNIDDDE